MYRNLEGELMLLMLQKDKVKFPLPLRDDMLRMIATARGKLNVNHTGAFKLLFVTNSLNGSGDYLFLTDCLDLSEKIWYPFEKKSLNQKLLYLFWLL